MELPSVIGASSLFLILLSGVRRQTTGDATNFDIGFSSDYIQSADYDHLTGQDTTFKIIEPVYVDRISRRIVANGQQVIERMLTINERVVLFNFP